MCVIIMLIGLAAASAMAGTVDVFGLTWNTVDDAAVGYAVNNPDSITITNAGSRAEIVVRYRDRSTGATVFDLLRLR